MSESWTQQTQQIFRNSIDGPPAEAEGELAAARCLPAWHKLRLSCPCACGSHQLGAGVHLVGFKEQARQHVPGGRSHRKHALSSRPEAACRGGRDKTAEQGGRHGNDTSANAFQTTPATSPRPAAPARTRLLRIEQESRDVAALQLLPPRWRLQQHLRRQNTDACLAATR